MGELPLRGAAAGLQKCRGCFLEISRCAGLLDWRNAEAAFGGAPAARGCWITDMRRLLLGGAFAARGCSLGVRKRLLLRDLPLRRAALLGKGRSCFLGSSRCAGLLDYRIQTRGGCFRGSSRCAGLLDWRNAEAAFGGAPAARGCWITDMRRLLLGGAFAARGCSLGVRKRLLLRDLPLRRAALLGKGRSCFLGSSRCAGLLDYRIQTRGGCFRGSSRCAGLLDWRNAEAAFGGAPAARGCWITDRRRLEAGERKKLLWGELPLRGAAGLQTGGGCFGGSSRCAGLLDWRNAESALGGAPAARGCSIGVRKRLLLGDLPLLGAARLGKGRSCFLGSSRCAGLLDYRIQTRGGCFWGSSRCAGLLDWRNAEAAFGGAPAARGCSIGERKKLLWGEIPLRGAAQ